MEKGGLLFHREVGMILDAAVEVHRVPGHGMLEKPYENALVREFELRGIAFVQQPRFPVDCKERRVGEFIPDLVVFDSVTVGTRTIDRIGDIEIARMINHLRITRLRVGIIINFKPGASSSDRRDHCHLSFFPFLTQLL